MSRYSCAQHCIERARERYGVELTHADIDAIASLCKPKNLMRRAGDSSAIHVVTYRATAFVVALVTNRVPPMAATFLQANYFVERSKRSFKEVASKAKKMRPQAKTRRFRQRIGGGQSRMVDLRL